MFEGKRAVRVTGDEFSITFDKTHGSISQWARKGYDTFSAQANGQDVLTIGVWRAPTDNDAVWQSAEWKNYGLNDTKVSVLSCEVVSQSDSAVTIACRQHLMPPILAWGFEILNTYTVHADGSISIKSSLKPFGPAPKTLPRIGLELQLSSEFDRTKWFGLGPGESYSDKKLSQSTGIHSASLDALQTRYDVPQEMGNHVETRWLKVTDARGSGFEVQYKGGPREQGYFQWALLKYDAHMLEKARHPCDLVARKGPLLRLDCDVAGLGTAACGPGTKLEDQVHCLEREFEFFLSPL